MEETSTDQDNGSRRRGVLVDLVSLVKVRVQVFDGHGSVQEGVVMVV
jgi:hypothetical protein